MQSMELLMSLLCCVEYPLLIYMLYQLIRYKIYKESVIHSLFCMLIPITLFITPTTSTEYSQITNFIRAINPYMLILFTVLYFIVLLRYIYLKIKKNK